VLVPFFVGLVMLSRQLGWPDTHPDANEFFRNILLINVVLLVFNLMPVYPLDGGQILRSLLWFIMGRANSLMAASILGFVGVAGLIGISILLQSLWLGILAGFILLNCWRGLNYARVLARVARIPRRTGFACPSCNAAPPLGDLWRCGKCGKAFDTFLTNAVCPQCGTQYDSTKCLDCGESYSLHEWMTRPPGNT
jgi:hypothetical protein